MNIDDRLAKVKYVSDEETHLKVNQEKCAKCEIKACTFVCPANVYEWNEEEQKIIVNYENCLECGACRVICSEKSLEWKYPKGTSGVTYKYG